MPSWWNLSGEKERVVLESSGGPQANAKTPAYVRIRIDGAAGTAWIDDVRIEEIAAPAAHR